MRPVSPGLAKVARVAAAACGFAVAACKPVTVADAEAKGDVAWLEQNGSPEAVAALGRLSDRDPRALAALQIRTAYDAATYRAAWMAVTREAAWGTSMLRAGLSDPKTADLAASGMGKHDPHLAAFVDPLENALVRLSASQQNGNVAGTLASAGPPAHSAVERRLVDASTRDAMCRGVASKYGDPDARGTLYAVAPASRDAPGCVEAVVRLASDDDWSLAWLAERAEPGILGAAGKLDLVPCARLHVAWVKALAARPAAQYAALTVPLAYAVSRCPVQIDGVLADTIVHLPAARGLVVQAIDPFAHYEESLHATCAALPTVASSAEGPKDRERAGDALTHICRAPE